MRKYPHNRSAAGNVPLLNKWFAGKRRLFLLTPTRDSGLGFAERLAYSYVVSRTSVGIGSSEREIADATHLDRFRTIRTVMPTLVAMNLVASESMGSRAIEPTGEIAGWFSVKNAKAEKWWDRYAYFPLYLQSSAAAISPRTNALLFLLYSLAAGGRIAEGQTCAGLAKMLVIHPRTVRRCLDTLEEWKLITVFPSESNQEWFSVGLRRPNEQHLNWFQKSTSGNDHVYAGLDEFVRHLDELDKSPAAPDDGLTPEGKDEELVLSVAPNDCNAMQTANEGSPSTAEGPRNLHLQQAEAAPGGSLTDQEFRQRLMRNCGYKDAEIREIEDLLNNGHGRAIGIMQFMGLLERANLDHERNRIAGKFSRVVTSSKLLRYEISRLIENKSREATRVDREFKLQKHWEQTQREEEERRDREWRMTKGWLQSEFSLDPPI